MTKSIEEATKDIGKDIEEVFDFLPEDYDVPSVSRYMKLEQGENKFRVLAKPLMGWEAWNEDKEGNRKPIRKPMSEVFMAEEVDEPDKIKHFWAMPVWNYRDKNIQILEITQKTILRTIKSLSKDKDWGNPINYDLSIVREGEGMKTQYQVIPSPPKPLGDEIKERWEETKDKLKLEALLTGDDPFKEL